MEAKDKLYRDAVEAKSETVLTYAGKRIAEKKAAEYERIAEEGKDFKMSLETHYRITQMIAEEKKKLAWQKRNRRMRKMLKICSIAILFVMGTGALLITNVDAFRYQFENFMVQIRKEAIQLTPDEGKQEKGRPNGMPAEWQGFWYPEYLPQGYRLDLAMESVDHRKVMVYKNDDGNSIEFEQWSAEGSNTYLDNEGDDSGQVKIREQYDGYWTKSNDEIILIWLQNDKIMRLTTITELDEIEKIAENLKYFK